MTMIEVNNKTKSNINQEFIKQILTKSLKYLKIKSNDISVALVSKEKIKKLNQSYRGQARPTDILSFNYGSSHGLINGEIVICPSIAKTQALEYCHSLNQEIARLLVHGLLHLLGHDHVKKKDRIKMEQAEYKIINRLK